MITLDWPPRELHPNARPHFRAKAAVTKLYRTAAYEETQSAAWDWSLLRAFDGDGAVGIKILFYPPDKRRRDLDGMLTSVKAGIDGISDALEINDIRLNPITIERCEPVKGGRVVVTLS